MDEALQTLAARASHSMLNLHEFLWIFSVMENSNDLVEKIFSFEG